MTSVAALPQTALSTPPAAPALAAKVARAADGDYKSKGVGHEVKDSDGDYKPTNSTASAASTTASSTLSALTSMKLGG
jgi:hypothetical protein